VVLDPGQLALDLEQVGLVALGQEQPGRPHRGELPTQLRADRATGAGDQHALAAVVTAQVLERQRRRDRVAGQQVLDAHLAHQPRAVVAAGRGGVERLVDAADDLDLDAERRARVHDPGHDLRRDAGRRDDHALGAGGPHHPDHVGDRAQDPQVADLLAGLGRVVVEEPDRSDAELGVPDRLLGDRQPALTGADDDGRQAGVGPGPLAADARDEPGPDHAEERQRALHDDDRERHDEVAVEGADREARHQQQGADRGGGLSEAQGLGQADVAPHQAIDPEELVGDDPQDHQRRDDHRELDEEGRGQPALEAGDVGQEPGHHHQHRVEHQLGGLRRPPADRGVAARQRRRGPRPPRRAIRGHDASASADLLGACSPYPP
jgi:hypothetical protein